MFEKNSCYTYFRITGNFDPSDITTRLDLSPSKQWRIGDLRRNGTKYDFASWEYGLCAEYNVYVENQMMHTIKELIPKIQELKDIKQKYDVKYTLEIVPSIYVGESNPCLAPNRAVIEFCYHTETDIDIDLYIFDSEETEI
ncbi:MAG: DUF4279 domain-containing protein [Clostridiales bacterium]|nr:DUF4279 domain-containing protein [Clostridiales bacterium]